MTKEARWVQSRACKQVAPKDDNPPGDWQPPEKSQQPAAPHLVHQREGVLGGPQRAGTPHRGGRVSGPAQDLGLAPPPSGGASPGQ